MNTVLNTQARGATPTSPAAVASGLEGIVVAETALSHVDGAEGRLIVVGHDIEGLAGSHSFEQLCAALWAFAGVPEVDLRAALGEAREKAFLLLPKLGDALEKAHAMDSLRAAVSHLASDTTAVEVVAALAVFAAAHARVRESKAPIAPDPSRGHADDFLHMCGLDTDQARVQGLDTYLVTVAEHGLNASTFATRLVASTGSDLVSSVVAGIGALKGPLHGGAPGPVLDMLDAVGTPAHADQWLRAELLRGERIMGMGHRIYRVRDPRALVLERAIEALEASLANEVSPRQKAVRDRLELARAIEKSAESALSERHPTRKLRANVEFYTAVLLEALGISRELFSTVFAVGRVLGWTAHVAEQRKTGRLIRPSSRYTGPMPEKQ